MSNKVEGKCSSCGANLKFNIAKQSLQCDYCGETRALAAFQVLGKEPLSTLKNQGNSWNGEKRVLQCLNCGAQEVVDANSISSLCPFCGSFKLTDTNLLPGLKPSGLLPFLYDKEQISKIFESWIKKKLFRPNKLKQTKISTFNGVYTPCWVFDSNVSTDYDGRFYNEHKDSDGDTHRDYFNVSGTRHDAFNNVAINVGDKINEGDFNTLKPFDFTKAVPYDPAYLLGFSASHYSKPVEVAFDSAKDYMKKRVKNLIVAEQHADGYTRLDLTCSFKDVMSNYLLLPVWIMTYKYNNKEYRIMSNGQTGELVGKTPRSPVKITLAVILDLIICGLLIAYVGAYVGVPVLIISIIALIIAIVVG